jgi:o-succinylbenzoate synthase
LRIRQVDVFQFKLPLARPLDDLTSRSGLILRLINDVQQIGHGEISPFPGFHKESLDDCLQQLIGVLPRLHDLEISADFTPHDLTNLFDWSLLSPSVIFGIEAAILNLIASFKHLPLAALLSPTYRKTVLDVGLLLTDQELNKELAELMRKGYQVIKLKVGWKPVEQDIENVKLVKSTIGDKAKLVLDANRYWDLETAIHFGRAIAGYPVEYIEEPLQDISQLERFCQQTGLPIAFDETLREIHGLESLEGVMANLPGIKAFIIKPDTLGHVERTFELARLAQQHNLLPVITNPFHAGLETATMANLAACVCLMDEVPSELTSGGWFAEDVLAERIEVRDGRIDVETACEKSQHMRTEALTPVSLA